MAKIIRKEIRKRGFFGKLWLLLFWAYNALMALWVGSYWSHVTPQLTAGSSAEQTGTAIGATLGTGVIMSFWVCGIIILGVATLLTRGKTLIIEEHAIDS